MHCYEFFKWSFDLFHATLVLRSCMRKGKSHRRIQNQVKHLRWIWSSGLQLYWKRDSGTGVFLWNMRNFYEYLFYRTLLVAASYETFCEKSSRLILDVWQSYEYASGNQIFFASDISQILFHFDIIGKSFDVIYYV